MLNFDVKFYDEKHRNLLEKLDVFSTMNDYTKKGFHVSKGVFLIYSVFVHQKNKKDFKTYNDLKKMVSENQLFQKYFKINNTVQSVFDESDDQHKPYTESAGVGAALSLASSLYGLTEADWERKPDDITKDLDFIKKASNGKQYIEVEAKGTIVDDVTAKISKISNKKSDIEAKKDEQRNNYDNKNTMLGVLTAIPSNDYQNAMCYLLDPPAGKYEEDPFKYRLLSRLYFYWRELHIVSKTHLLASLANRIKDIELVQDYKSLDSMPLLNRNNNEFDVPESLFWSLSTTKDKSFFGEVIPVNESETEYFFYGMNADIIEMLIQQNFKEITSLKFNPEYLPETKIIAQVKKSELKQYKDKYSEEKDQSEPISRKKINMVANLFRTPAGRVFGFARPI